MFVHSTTTDDRSDEELFARLGDGHRKALAPLWERFAHLLLGVAMKYLQDPDRAKDQVMDLFADLPALAKRHRVEAFRPWVHQVMRNRCLMELRKKDHHRELRSEPEAPESEMEAVILRETSLQALERALGQLPKGQATCIRFFYLMGQSYREVATRTGYPLEQVRSHLQNGRRRLRIILEQDGNTP